MKSSYFFLAFAMTAPLSISWAQNSSPAAKSPAKAKTGFFVPNPLQQPAVPAAAAAPTAAVPATTAVPAANTQTTQAATATPQKQAPVAAASPKKEPTQTAKSSGQSADSKELYGIQNTINPGKSSSESYGYGEENPEIKRAMAMIRDQQDEFQQRVREREAQEKAQQLKMDKALADAAARGQMAE